MRRLSVIEQLVDKLNAVMITRVARGNSDRDRGSSISPEMPVLHNFLTPQK